MILCNECITLPICRNKILEYIRKYKEDQKNNHTISYTSLIFNAYDSLIDEKCSKIMQQMMEIEELIGKPLTPFAERKFICERLNIKEEDYESL